MTMIFVTVYLATREAVASSLTFEDAAALARSLNTSPAGYRGLYGVETRHV